MQPAGGGKGTGTAAAARGGWGWWHWVSRLGQNFFPLRVTEPWPRLPREAVESPSLEIFKPRLDAVLCSLLWVTLLRQGVGLGDPQRSLPAPTMLGFCVILSVPPGHHRVQRRWVLLGRPPACCHPPCHPPAAVAGGPWLYGPCSRSLRHAVPILRRQTHSERCPCAAGCSPCPSAVPRGPCPLWLCYSPRPMAVPRGPHPAHTCGKVCVMGSCEVRSLSHGCVRTRWSCAAEALSSLSAACGPCPA